MYPYKKLARNYSDIKSLLTLHNAPPKQMLIKNKIKLIKTKAIVANLLQSSLRIPLLALVLTCLAAALVPAAANGTWNTDAGGLLPLSKLAGSAGI
jgi:hypothetical protein